jgi:hypothetical protein
MMVAMPSGPSHTARPIRTRATRPRPWAATILLSCALAASLGACGGGELVIGPNGFYLSLRAVVDGRDFGERIGTGRPVTITVSPGQSIEFDADEPVTWNFSVNGGARVTTGQTVQTGGLAITATAAGSSRVLLDISRVGPAYQPAVVTLTATSTFDAAQVVTVFVQVR